MERLVASVLELREDRLIVEHTSMPISVWGGATRSAVLVVACGAVAWLCEAVDSAIATAHASAKPGHVAILVAC